MAFTAEQKTKARQTFSAATSVADDALEGFVLDRAVEMHQRELSAKIDPAVLRGRAQNAIERVAIMQEKGLITTAQADNLKAAIGSGDQINAQFLDQFPNVVKTLELNKPNGLTDVKTGSQVAPRTEPGNDKPQQTNALQSFFQANYERSFTNFTGSIPSNGNGKN